jgi:hypothetical protein
MTQKNAIASLQKALDKFITTADTTDMIALRDHIIKTTADLKQAKAELGDQMTND